MWRNIVLFLMVSAVGIYGADEQYRKIDDMKDYPDVTDHPFYQKLLRDGILEDGVDNTKVFNDLLNKFGDRSFTNYSFNSDNSGASIRAVSGDPSMASESFQYLEDFLLIGYPHGVLVAPDERIWIVPYAQTDSVEVDIDGDGIPDIWEPCRAIYCFNEDGSQAAFSPIKIINYQGRLDTLWGSNRGISIANDGSILVSRWENFYRLNYLTGECTGWIDLSDFGSPTEAACDINGNIYIGAVLNNNPIKIYNSDLQYIGNVQDNVQHLSRSLVVTPDGNDVYSGSIYSGINGVIHYHSDNGPYGTYVAVDTLGTDGSYSLWAQCLDWGPYGNIWVGTYWDVGFSDPNGWYSLNPETGLFEDSIGVNMRGWIDDFPQPPPGNYIYSPRGITWSNDGRYLYTADFDGQVIKKWRYIQKSQIFLPEESYDFSKVVVGSSETWNMIIINRGSDILTVSDITWSLPQFELNDTYEAIASGDSFIVDVTFSPTEVLFYTDTLFIHSSDTINPVVEVSLQGAGWVPPEISVDVDSLTEDLYSGDMGTQTFTISNDGSSDLIYQIEELLPEGKTLSNQFESKGEGASSWFGNVRQRINISELDGLVPRIPAGIISEEKKISVETNSESADNRTTSLPQTWKLLHTDPDEPDITIDIQYLYGNVTSDEVLFKFETYEPWGSSVYLLLEIAMDVDQDITTGMYDPDFELGIDYMLVYFPYYGMIGVYEWDEVFEGLVWIADFSTLEVVDNSNVAILGVSLSDIQEPSAVNLFSILVDIYNDDQDFAPDNYFVTFKLGAPWLSEEPASGIIPAGDSEQITVTFDAAGLYGGDYFADILITSNDPANPELMVPAHLHVTGAPDISVSADTLDFSQVFIGFTDSLELIVKNNGREDLLISSVVAAPAEYTVSPSFAGVDPGEVEIFTVSFLPQAVGDYPGTLTFTNNDPNEGNYVVVLAGQGVLPPVILISPDSLYEALFTGDSSLQILTISNGQTTGGANLVFTVSVENAEGPLTKISLEHGINNKLPSMETRQLISKSHLQGTKGYPEEIIKMTQKVKTLSENMNAGDTRHLKRAEVRNFFCIDKKTRDVGDVLYSFPTPYQIGSAWGIGYEPEEEVIWISDPDYSNDHKVSLEGEYIESVTLSWVSYWAADIATDGDYVYQVNVGGDNGIYKMDLNGNVVDYLMGPWYSSQRGIAIDPATGDLYVGGWNDDGVYHIKGFDSDDPGELINFLDYSETNLAGVSGLAWHRGTGTLWIAVNAYSEAITEVDPVTGDVIQWFDFPDSYGYSGAGLDIDDEGNFWLVNQVNQTIYLLEGIPITNFVSVLPEGGIVPPQESLELYVRFDSEGLFGGDYFADIVIISNDPGNQELIVPVHLNVTGAADICIEVDSVDFGEVFVNYVSTMDLVIENNGTEFLEISSITVDNDAFSVSPSSLTIGYGEEGSVEVTFLPTSVESYEGVLTIVSNDPDEGTLEIPVFGNGVEPPVVLVSPDSLGADLFSGDTTTQTVTISNSGGSDLTFDIVIDNLTGERSQNYALQFDGVDGHVQLTDANLLGLTNNTFTVEAWIKITDYNGDDEAVLGSTEDYRLHFVIRDQKPYMGFWGNDLAGNTTLSTDTWYHLVWRYIISTGEQAIFVNGQLDSSETGHAPYQQTGVVNIGMWENGRYFNGQIDEFRIWNIARTEAEIQADMYQEIPGTEPGLVGYWRFNEGSGDTAFDQTSNGNDGSLYGGVEWVASTAPVSPSWLSITTTSGIVTAGSSMDIDVAFDATDLYGGDYLANIMITSNDPINPEHIVPVQLNVTGIADIFIEVDTIKFGTSFLGYKDSVYLKIANEGTDILEITNITTGDDQLTVTPSSLSITHSSSDSLTIYLLAENEGAFATTLSFSTNDPDTGEISLPVLSSILIAPDISVSPETFELTIQEANTIVDTLTISNTSGSNLEFDVYIDYLTGANSNNYAIRFGGNDYIDCGNNVLYEFTDWTIEAWIHCRNGGHYDQVIYSETGTAVGDSAVGDKNLKFMLLEGRLDIYLDTYGVSDQHITATSNLGDSKWHHVAAVKSGDNITLYVDAVNEQEETTIRSVDSGLSMRIGHCEADETISLDGLIDEVRIWNVARTQAEIQTNMYIEIQGTEPGLSAYWRLNEGSGNTIYDQTPYNHDGLLHGGLWLPSSSPISPDWLSITTTSGTVDAGSSMDIDVTIDATDLSLGEYSADIVITNNDPDEEIVFIPVTLYVSDLSAEHEATLPTEFALHQNYPNPFNPTTTIEYAIPKKSVVTITVYNIIGQVVDVLVDQTMEPGYYSVQWNARRVGSGVYFYRIIAGDHSSGSGHGFTDVKKCIILK